MKINNDVADVLSNSTVKENLLFLPDYTLDRKLYLSVNKVLDAIGGKWEKKKKAHKFKEDIAQKIDEILMTGEYVNTKIDMKKKWQFFETPQNIAATLIEIADIKSGETIAEPEAGRAAIAKLIHNCDCYELNPDNRKYLQENGYNVVGDDFLQSTKRYDVFVANPPFSKQQDIDHVEHMIKLANRCVVSVMSASVTFRTNKKTVDFRNMVSGLGGTISHLPDDAFKESGTMVKTCVVKIKIK